MAVPNMLSTVEKCAKMYPQDWKDAHTDNANTEGFIRKLASMLHAENVNFGLNGKRGNPLDISDDAINFKGEGADFDPTNGNSPCTVIDVIAGAGGPNPQPQWSIVTKEDAPVGAAWVQPATTPVEPTKPMVPWVAYDEFLFNDRLQAQLAYDYGRRPQAADFQVSVWSARVFHSTYMGPVKVPLGFDAAMQKHRPEWCEALKIPVDGTWF